MEEEEEEEKKEEDMKEEEKKEEDEEKKGGDRMGAPEHTYPELSVARATLVFIHVNSGHCHGI